MIDRPRCEHALTALQSFMPSDAFDKMQLNRDRQRRRQRGKGSPWIDARGEGQLQTAVTSAPNNLASRHSIFTPDDGYLIVKIVSHCPGMREGRFFWSIRMLTWLMIAAALAFISVSAVHSSQR